MNTQKQLKKIQRLPAKNRLAAAMIPLSILLLAALIWSFLGVPKHGDSLLNIKEKNFNTRKEAVESFMEGIAENQVKKILEASAVEDSSDYSFAEDKAEGLGWFSPGVSPWPGSYPMYRDFNTILNIKSLTFDLSQLIGALLNPEQDSDDQNAENALEQLEKKLDPSALSTLKFIGLIDAKDLKDEKDSQIGKITDPDDLDEHYNNLKKTYHLEDVSEAYAVFTWNDQPYITGITLMKKDHG